MRRRPERIMTNEIYCISGLGADQRIFSQLGVSFGGMMAVEIAKYYPAATVILVSSIGSRRALPWWMRTCGRLGLNRLMPGRPGKGIPWLGQDVPVEEGKGYACCAGGRAFYG